MPAPVVSQRFRRAIAYALLVTTVEAGLVALVAWNGRDAVVQSFDARLLSSALDASQRLVEDTQERAADVARDAIERSHDLVYVEVTDARGRRLGGSSISLHAWLPFARPSVLPDRALFGDVKVSPEASGLDADRVVRHVALPFLDEDGDGHVLHAVARSTGGREARDEFVRILRWVTPLSFVAAAVCAWMLERRALRPLQAVAAAAARVTPETLRHGIGVVEADGEIASLQGAVNQALQKLDAAFEERSRFAANVSHELRTPVAVLLAQAQVLDAAKATPAEVAEFRSSVEVEMRRLGRTIESFLLLARYGPDAAMDSAKPVQLMEVVLEAVHHGEELAREHGVRLVPRFDLADETRPPVVRGDPDLLRTLLDNLLANAVKFSPHGEPVDLIVTTGGAEVRITVRDRGPGIPPGYEEKVFDRQVQAPVEAPRRGGFGLGLSIVATVVRLHGGTVAARSRPDRGCEFVVTLPLVPEPASAAPREAGAGAPEAPASEGAGTG